MQQKSTGWCGRSKASLGHVYFCCARGDGVLYRIGKLVRRNRVAFAAACVLVLLGAHGVWTRKEALARERAHALRVDEVNWKYINSMVDDPVLRPARVDEGVSVDVGVGDIAVRAGTQHEPVFSPDLLLAAEDGLVDLG